MPASPSLQAELLPNAGKIVRAALEAAGKTSVPQPAQKRAPAPVTADAR